MKNTILIPVIILFTTTTCSLAQSYKRQVGKITYEIKDHLGNVSLVVNDVKDYDVATTKTTAHVVSAVSYYAFGMEMPGRTYSSSAYRYGYNGKEKDNELKGNGNSLDYTARIYDPRLGRWLSNDPLQAKYADLSPYHYCINNPIYFVDPNGKQSEPADRRADNLALSLGINTQQDFDDVRAADMEGTQKGTLAGVTILSGGAVQGAGRLANGGKAGFTTFAASLVKEKGDLSKVDYLDVGIASFFGFVFPGGLGADIGSEVTQAFFDWSPSEGFKNRGNNSLNQKEAEPFLADIGAGVGMAATGAVLKKAGVDHSGVADVAMGVIGEILEAVVGIGIENALTTEPNTIPPISPIQLVPLGYSIEVNGFLPPIKAEFRCPNNTPINHNKCYDRAGKEVPKELILNENE